MIMKWSIFKRIAAVVAMIVTAADIFAINLRPACVSCQTGGGMGIVSCGPGWRYGAGQRWETELFVGLIPKYDSNSSKVTFALKENFIPWQIKTGNRFTFEPLTSSLYFTTVISDRFWVQQPDRYPSGYYGLPTKIRTNISIGQRLKWHLPKPECFCKSISVYYEIGTCDIYVLSATGNSEIKLRDRLQLCIGVKLTFKKR